LHTTYKQNRFLDPEYIAYLESLREENPNYYKVYVKGEWGQNLEGLIFPNFSTCDDLPHVEFYGLDFGFNDPTALIAGCVVDEPDANKPTLYSKELLYKIHLEPDQLVQELDDLGIDKNTVIMADSSRSDLISMIASAGYYIKGCEKGAGSVKAGISEMQKHRLKITAGSKNLIKELMFYEWKTRFGVMLDEPVDKANHAIDATRYGLNGTRYKGFGVWV
jgi:phage terminase large subunit